MQRFKRRTPGGKTEFFNLFDGTDLNAHADAVADQLYRIRATHNEIRAKKGVDPVDDPSDEYIETVRRSYARAVPIQTVSHQR